MTFTVLPKNRLDTIQFEKETCENMRKEEKREPGCCITTVTKGGGCPCRNTREKRLTKIDENCTGGRRKGK